MTEPARLPAALAYIPLIGWVYVLIFQRKNPLAVFHLRQSIIIVLSALVAGIAWAVFGWVIGLVPLLGPLLGIASFGLVIAAAIYLLVMWVSGMIYALQGKMQPLPIPVTGRWVDRLPI